MGLSMKKPSKQKIFLLAIFTVLLFILASIIAGPIKNAFEFDQDEGTDIMKSTQLLKGFSLYNDISSDQPPLFTLILSFWFKLFGPSVFNARILILIFSGLLLWAFYQAIENLWGKFCAFIALIFLLLSTDYIQLSISVMLITPALAFAMLSIYNLTIYKKLCLKYHLILSGLFMALSLQTKLSTLFLLLPMALEIIQTKSSRLAPAEKRNQRFSPLALWAASLFIPWLIIAVLFFKLDFNMLTQQLFQSHISKSGFDFSKLEFSPIVIYFMLLRDYDICLLAVVGIILLLKEKKWRFFLPASWLILASLIILKWRPVWYHYYPFVSIPLCWLAGISFSEFFKTNAAQNLFKKRRGLYWITAGLITTIIFNLPGKYNAILQDIDIGTMPQEYAVLELISKYKKDTHWIVTDKTILAFYSKILVPPELALISHKRSFVGKKSQAYFIAKLEKYRPEQILLNKLEYYGPEALAFIKNFYTNAYQLEIPKRDKWGYRPNKTWYKYKICFANIKNIFKSARHLNLKQRYNLFPKVFISNYAPAYKISFWIRKDILEQNRKKQ